MKKVIALVILIAILFGCSSSQTTLVCRQPYYDKHMKKCLYAYRNNKDSLETVKWCANSNQQTFCKEEKINSRRR